MVEWEKEYVPWGSHKNSRVLLSLTDISVLCLCHMTSTQSPRTRGLILEFTRIQQMA